MLKQIDHPLEHPIWYDFTQSIPNDILTVNVVNHSIWAVFKIIIVSIGPRNRVSL